MAKSKRADGTKAFEGLHRLHKWLAIAYGLQLLLVLFLASDKLYPIIARYAVDRQIGQHVLFNASLPQIIGLWLGVSATFHALQAWRIRPEYEAALTAGESPYRWLENAFSSSLPLVALGLVGGMREAGWLGLLFVMGFVSQVLGWQWERHITSGDEQEARRSFVLFVVTSSAAWLAVGSLFVSAALWGWGISPLTALAFSVGLTGAALIAWIMWRRWHRQGRWQDFTETERAIILIIFVVKSALAWLLIG